MIVWTDEQVKILVQLWNEGKSGGEIADAFGYTRNKVMGRIHRMQKKGQIRSKTEVKKALRGEVIFTHKPKYKFAINPTKDKFIEPKSDSVPVIQITHKQCHFPFGDPQDSNFGYCGNPVSKGSYCDDCRKVMYKQEKPKKVKK